MARISRGDKVDRARDGAAPPGNRAPRAEEPRDSSSCAARGSDRRFRRFAAGGGGPTSEEIRTEPCRGRRRGAPRPGDPPRCVSRSWPLPPPSPAQSRLPKSSAAATVRDHQRTWPSCTTNWSGESASRRRDRCARATASWRIARRARPRPGARARARPPTAAALPAAKADSPSPTACCSPHSRRRTVATADPRSPAQPAASDTASWRS